MATSHERYVPIDRCSQRGPSSRQSSTRSSSSALGTPFRWTEVITCSALSSTRNAGPIPFSFHVASPMRSKRSSSDKCKSNVPIYTNKLSLSHIQTVVWRVTNKINHHNSGTPSCQEFQADRPWISTPAWMPTLYACMAFSTCTIIQFQAECVHIREIYMEWNR